MELKFSQRFKELRLEKGLSQPELAKIFKTGKASICNYEKGSRIPEIYTLVEYAQYFEVTVDYLLGLSDKK